MLTTHFKGVLTAVILTAFAVLTPLTATAANVRTTSAPGTVTYGNSSTLIDASNANSGYIMVKYTGSAPRIKVRVKKDTEYTYSLNTSGAFETFPLTEGSGSYTVQVYENVQDNLYSVAVSQPITVNLTDSTSPFLYPNQFCNFTANSSLVAMADQLVAGKGATLEKVEAVYNWVTDNLTYDYNKASTVQSGYLPNNETTMSTKTGICFDYASLMAAMLRVEDIPTRLVVGYAGDAYHAWVSVYSKDEGWIDNLIYFDGTNWRFMDPTFYSTGGRSNSAREYVSNPANYRAKFTY